VRAGLEPAQDSIAHVGPRAETVPRPTEKATSCSALAWSDHSTSRQLPEAQGLAADQVQVWARTLPRPLLLDVLHAMPSRIPRIVHELRVGLGLRFLGAYPHSGQTHRGARVMLDPLVDSPKPHYLVITLCRVVSL
jgi:hypothetical protein